MSKIGALFYNEIIKMKKRVSVWVIAIIMVVSIIGISGLIKLNEVWNSYGFYDYAYSEDYPAEIADRKAYLEDLNKDIQGAIESEDTENLLYLCNEKIDTLTSISELELRRDFTSINSYDFRDDLISSVSSYIEQVHQYTVMEEIFPGTQNRVDYEAAQEAVTALTNILKEQDYTGYVAYSKAVIQAMEGITQEEKDLLLEKWDILLKLDPTGGIGDSAENGRTQYAKTVASAVEALAKTIIYERDFVSSSGYDTGSFVTPKQIESYRDRLAAIRYCVDKDIEIPDSLFSNATTAYSIVSYVANVLITLLLIILAGGMISSEISTGSIKSLIIAPVRRWKIFIAKLLSLLALAAILTLVKYLFIVGTQTLFWPDMISPYVYASAGTAHSINYYLYQLAYQFADLLHIFMVALFALMLSTTTRNTALSVGLSMGIYFGGSMVNDLLTAFASGEWLKFLPFNHMDLADKIFPMSSLLSGLDGSYMNMLYTGTSNVSSISAGFTLVYILVLSFCMLYIAWDSFTRRDI